MASGRTEPRSTVLLRPYVQSQLTLAVEWNLIKYVTGHTEIPGSLDNAK